MRHGIKCWRTLWNVLEVWRQHANVPVEGRELNSGHYLAEEQPEEVLQEFLRPSPTKEYL